MFSFRVLLRAALVVAFIDGVAAGAAAQTACPPPTPSPTVPSSPTQPPRTQPVHVPTVTQQQLEEVQQYEPDLTLQGLQQTLEYGSYMTPPMTIDVLLQRLKAQSQATKQAASQAGTQVLTNPLLILPTRNRVLIFDNLDQPSNQFATPDKCGNPLSQQFTITFVGLQGVSQAYTLNDYYVGQEWLEKDGTTFTIMPPYAGRYSGTSVSPSSPGGPGVFQRGPVDLLNIPIPANIGPIIAVYVDTGGGVTWKIDKIVADGRTFSFANAAGVIKTRYSGHYVLGGGNGDYHVSRPSTWEANIGVEQCAYYNLGGAGVLLPPDISFGDSGTYVLPNKTAEWVAVWCTDPYIRPSWRSLYAGPTHPSFSKTVTIRLQLGSFPVGAGQNDLGPIIKVQLTGPNGAASSSENTDGSMIFSHEFVTFSVPGNFQVTGLNLTLTNGQPKAAPIQVTGAGMIVEQGVGAEVPIQDTTSLSAAVPSAAMKLYGASAIFDPSALLDPTAVADLLARSNDAIFDALAASQDQIAAINEFRNYSDSNPVLTNDFSTMAMPGEHLFDYWFLQSNDESVTSDDLLTPADTHFQQSPAPPGASSWPTVRARLQAMIDDRGNGLAYLDTLKTTAASAGTTLISEANLASLKLDLQTPIAACADLPATQDTTADFLNVANTAVGIGTLVLGPEMTEIQNLSQIFSIATYAESVTGSGIVAGMAPPPVCDAGANVNSLFSDTLGNLQQKIQAQIDALAQDGGAIDGLRPMIVRDANVLHGFAQDQLAYEKSLTPGAVVASDAVTQQYQAATGLEIRRTLATALLPIRAVIYGQPTVLYDQNSSTGMQNITAPNPPLTMLFPPAQAWPTLRDAPSADVCPASVGCDDHVLAFSAALALDDYNSGTVGYAVRPWFHEWRVSFWEGGANPPTVLPADVWTNYLNDIFATDDVFALLSPQTGRMLIGEWQYQCHYENPDGSPFPDLRGICTVQHTSSDSPVGPASDAITNYPMPVWQTGTITDAYTIATAGSNPEAAAPPLPNLAAPRSVVMWNTGDWRSSQSAGIGASNATGSNWVSTFILNGNPTFDFHMNQYADQNFIGPVLPIAWVRLH
jgi:hypothetical protein